MVGYSVKTALGAAALALLLVAQAADASKRKKVVLPPPPPPAPAQVWVFVPWKPTPPNHASPLLNPPPVGTDGLRQTVNRNISPAQTTWNLRSGFNVAALNCLDPKHSQILVNYKAFLRTHAKALRAANLKVDAEWRARYGAGFVRPREKFMTEVYNHFAQPPTLPAFCDAALAMSIDARKVKVGGLDAFAKLALPSLEIVFDDFYRRYDQYRVDLAAWDAKWTGQTPGTHILVPVSSPLAMAASPVAQP